MRYSEFATILDETTRRKFLGGLAGLGLAGVAGHKLMGRDTDQAEPEPEPQPEPAAPQAHPAALEQLLIKSALQAGMRGSELAQFLGQMKHESWNFSRLKEVPHNDQYFAKKYDIRYSPDRARRLGNTEPGDGELYHGRGFIQLTGKENYKRASAALGLDLVRHPEQAAVPDVAARIAIWYWNTKVRPRIQNFADTHSVTRLINPALKGLKDRHEKFKEYLASKTSEVRETQEVLGEVGDSNYAVQHSDSRKATKRSKYVNAKLNLPRVKQRDDFQFSTPDGKTYIIQIKKYQVDGTGDMGIDVSFYDPASESPFAVTGSGNAIRIFSTVKNVVGKYLSQDPSISVITFLSKNSESSRLKLYRTFLVQISRWFPEFQRTRETKTDDYVEFKLSKS